jgi:PQ loop repeat
MKLVPNRNLSPRQFSLLVVFGFLLSVDVYSAAFTVLRRASDLPALAASLGFALIASSTFPQIWMIFNQKSSGNLRTSLPAMLTLGSAAILPSVIVSGRLDLMLGGTVNMTSSLVLWLGSLSIVPNVQRDKTTQYK